MKAKKYFKIASIVLLFSTFFIILGTTFYAFLITNGTKLDKNALESSSSKKVKIFDNNNDEMDYFSSIKSAIPYEEISPYTIYAFVSLEDKRFFKHKGLDFRRILGATYNNLKAGYLKEGGSTITQQLAKNALLTQEKTIDRKLKEAKLSLEIEKNYSKNEIITKYLNTIYFGHSLYGINDACKRLFNKEPNQISIGESAILAGIVKNPLKNSPLNSVDNAISRRNLVLKLMLEQGYIVEKEYEQALKENYSPPVIEKTANNNIPYTQAVITECANILGISEREVITKGYIIHTFFDKKSQNSLDLAYNHEDLLVDGVNRTYLLADNTSGGICAYASSINYSPHEFRRQGASTLKPIISYAPALEQGLIIPDSPILDEKCEIRGYSPNNYRNLYLGWTTVRDSLKHSSNACSLKLIDRAGLPYALNMAKDFGLMLDKNDGLACALGGTTYGQTPVELVKAYMTLANEGKSRNIGFINSIYDTNGKWLYKHEMSENQVVSKETAYFLTEMMIDCAKTGTAKKLSAIDFQLASKTGTNGNSNYNFDAWNLSYTTSHTLAVWYGSKDYSSGLDLSVSGGSYPTLGAKSVWTSLGIRPKNFNCPNTLEYLEIDKYAFDNNHILMLSNENTPICYKKPILTNTNFLIPVSNYFDNAIPSDFNVIMGDGEIIISLTQSKKFWYSIENGAGEVIYKIEKGSNKVDITLPKPRTCFELYYLVAYTEDNVLIKKSQPKIVIIF